jgi:AraC-like DNA-binding protein
VAKRACWQPDGIEKVSFTLSEERPLDWALNTHAKPQNFMFDMHYELELGVVLSGKMHRQYEDYRTELSPGDVWFCGMWEPHGYRITSAPCRALVFVILPQMLVDMHFNEAPGIKWLAPFTTEPRKRPRAPDSARKKILTSIKRFVPDMKLDGADGALWQRLLLLEILLILKSTWPERAQQDQVSSTYYTRVSAAVELVFSSREMVTLEDAARACSMSRNHFHNIFQELMGLSFAKFALRHRLTKAASRLLTSADAVKTIAAEWGFTDASHLHHCFQKHYGCSPAAFRQRSRSRQTATPEAQNIVDASTSKIIWNARGKARK